MAVDAEAAGLRRRLAVLVVLLIGMCVLALVWRVSGVGESRDVAQWIEALRASGRELGVVRGLVFVILAAVLAVPLAVILLACALTYGPLPGLGLALAGTLVGAVISFLIGQRLGHAALCRLAGPRVNRLSARLGERGMLSVVAIRMVPIAPFAVINMIAGTTHIGLLDFVVGSLVGMLPGAVAITAFSDQVASALVRPGAMTLAGALVTLALIVAGAAGLRRWLGRPRTSSGDDQ